MSFHVTADNLEEIHRELIYELMRSPDFESAPRGKPIKELLVSGFTLTNPRNRIITSPVRAANYGFGVGELCWYIRGDKDLETMLYYNKRMAQFSDNGKTINSAYGARMFNDMWKGDSPVEDRSQLDNVIEELKKDPDSRRAVMHINRPDDLLKASNWGTNRGSKDVPCTMSLQLLIRERELHMHVLMRSNDVIWGLPYDTFSFTCLQECFLYMLQEAGVPVDDLGSYHHTAGSLHIYDTHFTMAEGIMGEATYEPSQMKPFTLAGIRSLAEDIEPNIRLDGFATVTEPTNESERWMFNRLCEQKEKRLKEMGDKQ